MWIWPTTNWIPWQVFGKWDRTYRKTRNGFFYQTPTTNSVEALQRFLEFVNFYRCYLRRLATKTAVLHELIKKDTTFKIEQRHKDVMFEINESLLKATKLSLKLPLSDKQLVILCDASQHAAGYVLLLEDYSEPQWGTLRSMRQFFWL